MVGIDIISVHRIENMLIKYDTKFLARFLNDGEYHLAKNAQSTAGLWAAKEAASKALGCGICESLSFHDMTVTKSLKGSPSIVLSDKAAELFKVKKIHISITHDGGFSAAVAFASK